MMRINKVWSAVAYVVVLGVFASNARGDVQVSRAFGNHMVLQRDTPVPVWGTAAAGEKVTVEFGGQEKSATADKDGKWMVKLDALSVGEPASLTVRGNNAITFVDVLVGDVWVGSGQSNMAGSAAGYARRDEVLAAMINEAPYPKLRLYRGGWKEATPDNIRGFSALLFSFGQPLQEELGVPVGLIVGAVGGTPSGRWLSPAMFEADPGVQAALKKSGVGVSLAERQKKYQQVMAEWEQAVAAAKKAGKQPPRRPRSPIKIGDLYEAHIQPVVPYAIRGVLWDQGESGTAVPGIDQFTMMGALIRGWRDVWRQGEFPFLYVQKPSGGGCAWDNQDPVTRMADAFTPQPTNPNRDTDGLYRQLHIRIMQHPNTAMVTANDLGSGVHPLNKSGYGRRACRVALGFAYERDVEYYGPIYDSHAVEGNAIRIRFKHIGRGLAFNSGDKLQGFEVAGTDGVFQWGDAKIDGDTVVVSSDAVEKPVHVRYGWSRNRTWANLFNKDGLPALTFCTRE
jgi:sialate O-acetylesterase